MRILHVVPTYLPATRYGGPIHAVHGLCRALAERSHEVEVFTTNVDGDYESAVPLLERVEIDSVGVTYFPSQFRRTYWSPAMKRRLRSVTGTFDLVHLHSIFLHPTLAAARAARDSGVPYVISPRGMLVKELIEARNSRVKRVWISIFERQSIESASGIHLTSEQEARDLRAFDFQLRRIDVIPNGIDLDPPIAREKRRGKYILFLGRLNWKKRPAVLIESLGHLPEEWTAVLAGPADPGIEVELRELASRLGVSARVEFTGEVSGQAKRELLAGASMLVLPSISENFGNVILEAAIEQVPSAMTRGVGLSETFENRDAAFILEGPADTFGIQIRDFVTRDLVSFGIRARHLTEREFGWDRVAATMESMYQQIIGTDPR